MFRVLTISPIPNSDLELFPSVLPKDLLPHKRDQDSLRILKRSLTSSVKSSTTLCPTDTPGVSQVRPPLSPWHRSPSPYCTNLRDRVGHDGGPLLCGKVLQVLSPSRGNESLRKQETGVRR